MSRDGYQPLPNERQGSISARAFEEMDMAFESDDDIHHGDEPLAPQVIPSAERSQGPSSPTQNPPVYDFERDYDYPPPGSPSSSSSPTDRVAIGNSNGIVPSPSSISQQQTRSPRTGTPSFLRRAVGAILPTHYTRIPSSEIPDTLPRPRGSGMENDGVFSNVLAKPTGTREAELENRDVHVMPEESQKDAPPSYAVAQADAVPPYWETTIHAPHVDGTEDLMVEGLPAGSIFSFAWNFLISVSFQFIGFMLTYLLHTTHAAKFGSRAGLGLTLIQYGLYSRGPDADTSINPDTDEDFDANPLKRAVNIIQRAHLPLNPRTWTQPISPSVNEVDGQGDPMMSSAHDWLSFLLMTIGWFLLLSSVLGFVRVKRWERSLRNASIPRPPPSPEDMARDAEVRDHLQRVFGIDLSDNTDGGSRHDRVTTSEVSRHPNIRQSLRVMGMI